MTAAPLDRIALALSDPIRLQVLDLLAAGRDQVCCSPNNPEAPTAVCACDIEPNLVVAPSRLSYHMKVLREAGLITEQKKGRWVYYSLNREALLDFMQVLTQRYVDPQPAACCSPLIQLEDPT